MLSENVTITILPESLFLGVKKTVLSWHAPMRNKCLIELGRDVPHDPKEVLYNIRLKGLKEL